MHGNHIRNLYLKFIQRLTTRHEEELLIKVLESSKDDSDLPEVDEVNELFQERKSMDDQISDRIFNQIINSPSDIADFKIKPEKQLKLRKLYQSSWLVAASIMLFMMIGVYTYNRINPEMLTVSSGFAQKRMYKLPDGTQVFLNANTKIKINKNFNEKVRREVWIEGEAFFSVAHNKKKPFIVHTPVGMDVEVLGTEFNVNSKERQSEVVLNRGSVKVMLGKENDPSVTLVPGEMARLEGNGKQLYKTKVDTIYYSSWKYDLLPFRDKPFREVAQTIKNVYGYEVIFMEQGQDTLHFTGSIPSNNLNKVIKTLASVLNADIKVQGKRIYINQFIN